MKKLQFLTYLFAALFTITMVSCSDDDDKDDDTISPGKEALLIAETWRGDKVYFMNQDYTEQAKAYLDIKTTTLEFRENGTYIGSISGGPAEEGTWEFSDNETKIILDKDTDNFEVTVKRLTATELWVEGDFLETGGQQNVELRFIH